ncbi:MAG: NAD(P)H-dependent flavin oxidoreductase, partial [Candidatus Binataceae bacterium]
FEQLGLEPPQAPEPRLIQFERQMEVVLDENAPIFSFTFGIPDPPFLKVLKQKKMTIIGTATTVAEARALADAGVDAIVAQGSEAGAHRGSFMRPLEESLVGGLALVPQAVDAVPVPVIASGGIMDGRGIIAARALGAAGVQMGTAFLTCAESGASQAYKDAVCAAGDDATTLTRAFSGRLARGIVNSFIDQLEPYESAFLPFPLQNSLTRPLRTAAAKKGDTRYMSLWAGQAASLARPLPARELIDLLVREAAEALSAMNR